MRAWKLAWLQLTREKLRLLVAVSGVAFAVILIFMQLGFQEALFKSSTRFHEVLNGGLFIISPQQDMVAQPKTISRRRLYQAMGFEGVAAVRPVYMGLAVWKDPTSRGTRTIFIVGIDPSEDALLLSRVKEQADVIRMPDVVLYDEASRPEFGPIPELFAAGKAVHTEVANRRIAVGGLFEMGTSFGIDGTIITSDLNFLRIFPLHPPGLIGIGVIRLQPGADPAAIGAAMRAQFPPDVLVLTKSEFIEREKHYWQTSTPIGYVFRFGVIMGLVVGAIIVYQILFADVSDHLAEYATLKAMGYPSSYLFTVVLGEACVLAVLGFLPGMAICTWLYRVAGDATRLPLEMSAPIVAFVLNLALLMCSVSGLIAVRKIRSADPAEIF